MSADVEEPITERVAPWRRAALAFTLAAGVTALVLALNSSARAEAGATPQVRASELRASELRAAVPGLPTGGAGTIPGQTQSTNRAEQLQRGEELFLTSCVSCHGVDGVGGVPNSASPRSNGGVAPSLVASGEASADFMLRTGRMPMTAPAIQPPTKPVAYTDDQIQDLVVYVGSLCDATRYPCPAIPKVDPSPDVIQEGGELFLANCAPCHNSVAIGGALSRGRHAPSLQETGPTQVAEAIRTGPGDMPLFGPDVFTDKQVNAIVTYVEYLHEPATPGGTSLGYTGPVAEGFVALLVGLGALVLVIRWITREPTPSDSPTVATSAAASAAASSDGTDASGAQA